jgi:hypothetical protein
MKKKFSIIFFLFILLSSCGYEALYSSKSEILNIEILDFKGDSRVNSKIIQKLNRYKNNSSELYEVSFETYYTKKESSKNSSGKIENYRLSVISNFIIKKAGIIKNFSISENFTMKNIDDEFQELNYENKIKENIADSIVQKLIIQLKRF